MTLPFSPMGLAIALGKWRTLSSSAIAWQADCLRGPGNRGCLAGCPFGGGGRVMGAEAISVGPAVNGSPSFERRTRLWVRLDL